jgi:peptidoglycan/xylan/chitin deacetylase (PgdA/CDA1 family)
LKIEGINRFVPSPHRDYLALLKSSGVSLVNPETMEEVIFIDHPEPRDLFWMSSSRFLIAGSRRIELVNTDGSGRELLCLSQVEKSGFDARGKLRASSSGKIYDWDFKLRHWTSSGERAGERNGEVFREPVFETRENRVYLEENVIVVRTVPGFGNRRILHREETEPLSLPESADFQEEADSRILFHGSRTGKKRVALVFNAPEGNEGLNDVLRTLRDYNLRVTFFIGGDFIRRNPESTRILAESGYETGSLFYTCIDLTDIRYRIDKNFIVRGLGRNEDSFFRETGSEVSTIWHAPWYVVSPSILEATEDMNYLYIGRDVDSRDRPVQGDSQRHVPELIESILERVQPGSIIPVQIGRSGEREDYLFQNLDLLINGLLNEGYEIVTVHELREPDR